MCVHARARVRVSHPPGLGDWTVCDSCLKLIFDSSCVSPYRADSGSTIARVGPRVRSGMYRSRGLSQPMRE